MTGVYIFAGCVLLFLVYLVICMNHTAKLRHMSGLLLEMLECTEWADILEMLKCPEYVEAVVNACGVVLEEAG